MGPDLSRRVRQDEWMDDPAADPAMLASSLRFIRRINLLLRYTSATLSQLQRWSAAWPHDRPIKILDVATGSADVPLAIQRWADKRRLNVEITGIDLHAVTAAAAAAADPRIRIVRGDATRLPFADASFDYVMTSMFLHHLDEDVVVAVLKEMDRVVNGGVLAADLLRSPRAYAWITLFTLASNPMVRHDARASVAQAFSMDEVIELRDAAGLAYCTPSRHFGHRFILAGEKPAQSRTATS